MKKFQLFICLLFLLLANNSLLKSQDVWANYKPPTIVFVDEDKVSQGALIFNRLVTNHDSLLTARAMTVIKILYKDPSEVPNKTIFNFALRLTTGVAATGGQGANTIDMFLNSQYVADFYSNNNSNDQKTLEEIIGVLTHELTHGYQLSPNGAGGYVQGTDYWAFIEGEADGVRTQAGLIPMSNRHSGGTWLDGYQTTGFFINSLTTLDPDFIYKFNQTANTVNPWSWDLALKSIFQKSLFDLWDDYQKVLLPTGSVIASFTANKTTSYQYENVTFYDQSITNPYTWLWKFEGVTPDSSKVKNPVVNYSTLGTYGVTLAIRTPYGTKSTIKNKFITIVPNPSGVLINSLGGDISSKYTDSPGGEGMANAFDTNIQTKYLTFNNSTWIQYNCKNNIKYQIKKFILTSANDAEERDPAVVVLKGSVDGTTWTTIDTKSNIKFTDRNTDLIFTVTTTSLFSKFRFEMTASSGTIFQIADIKMFGISETVLGIDNLESQESDILISPNPAKDYLKIGSSMDLNNFTFSIASTNGIIFNKNLTCVDSNINIEYLPKGSYILIAESKITQKRFVKKFIKL